MEMNVVQTATKEHVNAPWSGNKKNFRCAICGHKLKVGDKWAILFTNKEPSEGKVGFGGNPIVCGGCFTTLEETMAKWKERCRQYYGGVFWWFTRHNVDG